MLIIFHFQGIHRGLPIVVISSDITKSTPASTSIIIGPGRASSSSIKFASITLTKHSSQAVGVSDGIGAHGVSPPNCCYYCIYIQT